MVSLQSLVDRLRADLKRIATEAGLARRSFWADLARVREKLGRSRGNIVTAQITETI